METGKQASGYPPTVTWGHHLAYRPPPMQAQQANNNTVKQRSQPPRKQPQKPEQPPEPIAIKIRKVELALRLEEIAEYSKEQAEETKKQIRESVDMTTREYFDFFGYLHSPKGTRINELKKESRDWGDWEQARLQYLWQFPRPKED